jgi:hypothetical protein
MIAAGRDVGRVWTSGIDMNVKKTAAALAAGIALGSASAQDVVESGPVVTRAMEPAGIPSAPRSARRTGAFSAAWQRFWSGGRQAGPSVVFTGEPMPVATERQVTRVEGQPVIVEAARPTQPRRMPAVGSTVSERTRATASGVAAGNVSQAIDGITPTDGETIVLDEHGRVISRYAKGRAPALPKSTVTRLDNGKPYQPTLPEVTVGVSADEPAPPAPIRPAQERLAPIPATGAPRRLPAKQPIVGQRSETASTGSIETDYAPITDPDDPRLHQATMAKVIAVPQGETVAVSAEEPVAEVTVRKPASRPMSNAAAVVESEQRRGLLQRRPSKPLPVISQPAESVPNTAGRTDVEKYRPKF